MLFMTQLSLFFFFFFFLNFVLQSQSSLQVHKTFQKVGERTPGFILSAVRSIIIIIIDLLLLEVYQPSATHKHLMSKYGGNPRQSEGLSEWETWERGRHRLSLQPSTTRPDFSVKSPSCLCWEIITMGCFHKHCSFNLLSLKWSFRSKWIQQLAPCFIPQLHQKKCFEFS